MFVEVWRIMDNRERRPGEPEAQWQKLHDTAKLGRRSRLHNGQLNLSPAQAVLRASAKPRTVISINVGCELTSKNGLVTKYCTTGACYSHCQADFMCISHSAKLPAVKLRAFGALHMYLQDGFCQHL